MSETTMLSYLSELSANNNREWYHAHKAEYQEANGQFEVRGTSHKNVPKEYPADCAVAQYLKYKSWYIEVPVEDGLLQDLPAFVEFASEWFLQMKPFNDFLNRALDGFTMPAR